MAKIINQPGRLNRWVGIRKQLDVPNGSFGITPTYSEADQRWAAIDPVGSLTFYGAKQTGTDVTDHITFRREPGTCPEDFTTAHVIEEVDEEAGTFQRYRVVRATDWAGRRQYTQVETTNLGVFPL